MEEPVSPICESISKTFVMACVSLGFLGSFLFLVLFVIPQTLAKPAASQMDASVNQSGLVETKKCNNVYFYEAPNGKIESMLQAVMKQLAHMQKDIDIIKEKKNATKGKKYGFWVHTGNYFNCTAWAQILSLLLTLNVWFVHQFSRRRDSSRAEQRRALYPFFLTVVLHSSLTF